jgi:hypothetical protein
MNGDEHSQQLSSLNTPPHAATTALFGLFISPK